MLGRGGVRGAAWAMLAGVVLASPALAQGDPELSVVGEMGLRGGTVAVLVSLANDTAYAAVTADLDIDFPTDLVTFHPPVRTNCAIAPRLAATHQVGGMLPEEGVLRLAIFARGLNVVPLGDGDLATCNVQIREDALSSPAPLTVAFASLGDSDGQPVDVVPVDGEIVITDAPNQPTPTPTVLPRLCVADCNDDGMVAVNEVILGVNIALENATVAECPDADSNGNGAVTIGELIEAINDVISGC